MSKNFILKNYIFKIFNFKIFILIFTLFFFFYSRYDSIKVLGVNESRNYLYCHKLYKVSCKNFFT